ncbi:MAG: hypothetical protein HEQ35_14245 [Gloeotrichia echinulata IR180]
MEDCEKTKKELIAELEALREQVRDLKSNQGTTGQGKERQQLITRTALYILQSLKLDDILNATVTGSRKILQCDRTKVESG